MISTIISYSISYIISYIYYRLPILMVCPALSLQRPILPGHSALMQAMVATIRTEKWIQIRHVTMLIKALCQSRQTGTWQKTMRFLQHF